MKLLIVNNKREKMKNIMILLMFLFGYFIFLVIIITLMTYNTNYIIGIIIILSISMPILFIWLQKNRENISKNNRFFREISKNEYYQLLNNKKVD